MTSLSTAFNPNTHGFKFTNSFSFEIRQRLPLIGEVNLADIVIGLCGGMCFTSLDYFHAGVPVPSIDAIPAVGSRLHNQLIFKQIQSLIPPHGVIKVLSWTSEGDDFVWRHTAGREFGKLRTRLGRGEPAVLALIRADEGEDPKRNHQVVGHDIEFDEDAGDVAIGIYDPNYPAELVRLTLNRAEPRSDISARQSTGELTRGFFVIDYVRGSPPNLGN